MTEEERQSNKRKGKPHRRGSGSVFRRPERKGKQWVAQLILENGKARQRYFNTQAEAEEALTEMLYERRRGMLATGPKQTLSYYLEYWLELRRTRVRESTYTNYAMLIKRHILPALGQVRLQELKVQQIDALYMSKQQEGLSSKTIRCIHNVLHSALNHAVRINLLARNVADVASPPRKTKKERRSLTQAQVRKLLETARGYRIEGLLTVALATGMRRGELLGLTWQDVNPEQRTLQVQRTVNRIGRRGFVVGEPKTATSRRQITLPPSVIDVLRQHKARQEEDRKAAGATWEEHDLVFCNRVGRFLDPATLHEEFTALLKAAGLPHMRFHDLRHTTATLLLEKGIHAKIVQELLGHSTIAMTMDIYSHVLPSIQQEAVDKLDDLFR